MVTVAVDDERNPYHSGEQRNEYDGEEYGYKVNNKTLTRLGEKKPETRLEKIEYLERHERHSDDGYYRPSSYANVIKVASYRLPRPLEMYDYYAQLETFWDWYAREAISDFEDAHAGYEIVSGGRSGGYLVLMRGREHMGNYEVDYSTEHYDRLIKPLDDWKERFDEAHRRAVQEQWGLKKSELEAAWKTEADSIMTSFESIGSKQRALTALQYRFDTIVEGRYKVWNMEWAKQYRADNPPPTQNFRTVLSSWTDEDIDREFDIVWAFDIFTHNFICEFVHHAFDQNFREVIEWLGTEDLKQVNGEKGFPDHLEVWLPEEWSRKDGTSERQRWADLAQRAGILKFKERDDSDNWEIYVLTEKYNVLLTQF